MSTKTRLGRRKTLKKKGGIRHGTRANVSNTQRVNSVRLQVPRTPAKIWKRPSEQQRPGYKGTS